MKCLILAGGYGERVWPLSRKNYPKQFMSIQNHHSIFQETVARNLPYCDEFIIITGYEYRYIIENQMAVFQGTAYSCIYEEIPLKTAAAITLACKNLPSSELVFVVSSNHLLESSKGLGEYKEAVLKAKNLASKGRIVAFDVQKQDISSYGESGKKDFYMKNGSMYLFEIGVFENELKQNNPHFYQVCQKLYRERMMFSGFAVFGNGIVDTEELLPIEKILMDRCKSVSFISVKFGWKDITCLEDIFFTDYQQKELCVCENSPGTLIINNNKGQLLCVNGIKDAMIVSTRDVVYVGKRGKSDEIKELLLDYPEMQNFRERGTVVYRKWGFYEEIFVEHTCRIRKVTLFPGKSIFPHRHKMRKENWTILEGTVIVILDGVLSEGTKYSNIDIPIGTEHQISNTSDRNVVFIETALGKIVHEQDNFASKESIINVERESFVKLRPAFKDYLWGGKKIRDIYKKNCDLDKIAESWELSVHPAGQSIVDSGKFKGIPLGRYLEYVGKDGLGWKVVGGTDFPLLVKFIDAKDNLSVQVHPDNDYALEHEGEYGKNEMWYILDSEPGACIYIGFKQDVSREEVEKRVKDNSLLTILNKVITHPGNVFFIPAGTIHAIGAGNLLCEIQQNSNCTYRLYDYERKDKYGNPRELHLQKALDVLNYQKYQPQEFQMEKTSVGTIVGRCKYFEAIIYDITDRLELYIDNSHFGSLVCLSGNGWIESKNEKEKISAGDSFFVRADEKIVIDGICKVILSYI